MFFYVAKNQKQNKKKGFNFKRLRFIFGGAILSVILSFAPKKEVKAQDLNIATETNLEDVNLTNAYNTNLEIMTKTQNKIASIYDNMLSSEIILKMDYQSQLEYYNSICNRITSITNNAMKEASNIIVTNNINLDNSLDDSLNTVQNEDVIVNTPVVEEVAQQEIINTPVVEESIMNEQLKVDNQIVEETIQEVVEVETPIINEPVIETNTNEEVSLKPVINEIKADKIENQNYSGIVLTPSIGVVNNGPSGKETYYNLKMTRVVETMRRLGFSEEEYPYYEREDGAKCLGPYVMVAANLSVHPRGSFVETTLGMGIVCDTGSFAKKNPNQVDIATNWGKSRTLKKNG